MEWFHKAAEQGHPQAAYNLAVGHLRGHKTNLQPGWEAKWVKTEWVPERMNQRYRIYNEKMTKRKGFQHQVLKVLVVHTLEVKLLYINRASILPLVDVQYSIMLR